MTTIAKILLDEEKFVEKKRTRALATGRWQTVIECEAKLELIKELNKKTVLAVSLEYAPSTTSPS